MRRLVLVVCAATGMVGGAEAQSFGSTPGYFFRQGPDPLFMPPDVRDYLMPQTPNGRDRDGLAASYRLPLSAFASADSITLLNYQMRRDFDRLREGVALAGAINVMPPNPGDRFAITFGGAAYGGTGAGAVSFSYRMTDSILAYGAVSQGRTQTMVKGGVTFSFR